MPGEISLEFRFNLAGHRRTAQHHIRAGARLQPLQLGGKRRPVGKFEEMQGMIVGDDEHRADRRIDPVALQEALALHGHG
ncbi:hypothetical protein D3C78_1024280 [compost metagenome]